MAQEIFGKRIHYASALGFLGHDPVPARLPGPVERFVRHGGEPEASAKNCADVLALWPENRAAEENLAKLQGKQPEKPGIL
ncbi:MAG: hypothetical protein ACOZEN_10855 [Thermodesulfobacteriota bacterium]